MTDSRDTVHGTPPKAAWFASWRAIDSIYVWSALVGLVVALLLIGIGMAMEMRVLR